MNILYFTLDDFDSLVNYHSINTDLLEEFKRRGHNIYVVSPSERRKGVQACKIEENGAFILKPVIGNIQKTNIIEKGISTITIGSILIKAIKKELKDVRFDLVLYCTPPITFLSAIRFVKKRDGAKTYLLLKDIFPQNAVDIGILRTFGIRGLLYRYFRNKEKKLYRLSDRIGCMSEANADYLIRHNPAVDPSIVTVSPNSVEVIDNSIDEETRTELREKYDLPKDRTIFVYGGNLGKPQGIPFVIECLKKCKDVKNVFFLIVGDGTEYGLLERFINESGQENVKLIRKLPREEYDRLVAACDVGLIFLDYRFTIPNFPSRILSYMQAKLPVLAATDLSTDIGKVITDGGFGRWCGSNGVTGFVRNVNEMRDEDLKKMGENGFDFLKNNYCVKNQCDGIINRI
jgi:hypothetical protein